MTFKKYVLVPVLALVIAGGAFLGGHAFVSNAWDSAYAEGAASVDAGPEASAVPDPVSDPSGAAEAVWELWKGARLPAIILAAFLLAVAVHRKGWLKGRPAFYLGSVVAAAGVIAERAAAGDSPSVALTVQFLGTILLAAMKFELGGKEQA